MKLLYKGAEANLYIKDGRLLKERIKKEYRIPEIDIRVRKSRTKHEAKLLEKLRDIGVNTPRVLQVDKEKNTIVMEYVDGEVLKKILDSKDQDKIKKLSREVGRTIALMHEHNIIHNDLTTSNMLYGGGKIYFIDLGLGYVSTRVEDKAMDLVVLKKSLMASHTRNFDVIWTGILGGYGNQPEVVSRSEQIERRVRYAGGGG